MISPSDLRALMEEAGDPGHLPLPPERELPKRWLPPPFRILFKGVCLPFVWIDVGMQKVARFLIRPPFIREGACKKRGNCCYYVLIQHSPYLLGKFFYWWYTQVHGFYRRFKEPLFHEGKRVYVMGCRYLKTDGTCGQYRLRPLICREWPVVEYFGKPRILKGCGYRVSSPPSKQSSKGHPKLSILEESSPKRGGE